MLAHLNLGDSKKAVVAEGETKRIVGGIETSCSRTREIQKPKESFLYNSSSISNSNNQARLGLRHQQTSSPPPPQQQQQTNSDSSTKSTTESLGTPRLRQNQQRQQQQPQPHSTAKLPASINHNSIRGNFEQVDADNSVTNGNTISLNTYNKNTMMESSIIGVPSSPTTATNNGTEIVPSPQRQDQQQHQPPHTILGIGNINNTNNQNATTASTTMDTSALGVILGTPDTTSTAPSTPDISVDFTLMEKISLRTAVPTEEVQFPADLPSSPWFVDGGNLLSQQQPQTNISFGNASNDNRTQATTTSSSSPSWMQSRNATSLGINIINNNKYTSSSTPPPPPPSSAPPMTLLRWDSKESGPTPAPISGSGLGMWNIITAEQHQQDETQRRILQQQQQPQSYLTTSSPGGAGVVRWRPTSSTSSLDISGGIGVQQSFPSLPTPSTTLKPRPTLQPETHTSPGRLLWSPGAPPPPPSVNRQGCVKATSFIPDVGGMTEHNKNRQKQQQQPSPSHSNNPWNERVPIPQNYLNRGGLFPSPRPGPSNVPHQHQHHSNTSSYGSPARGGIRRWSATGGTSPYDQHQHYHQQQPHHQKQSPLMSARSSSPGLPRSGIGGIGEYQRQTGSSPNRSLSSSSTTGGAGGVGVGRPTSAPQRSSSEVLKTLLRKKACLYEPETSPAVALITWLVGRALALTYGHFSRQQLQSGVHGCVASKIESGIITRTKVNRCMQIILNSCFHYIIPAPGGGEESSELFRANFAQTTTDDSPLIQTLQAPWDDICIDPESILQASTTDDGGSGSSPPLSSINSATAATSGDGTGGGDSTSTSKRIVLLCFNENVRSADDVFYCHHEFIRDTANASRIQLTAQEWQAFFGKSTMKDLTGKTRMMGGTSYCGGDETSMMGPLDVLGQLSSKDLARFRTTWCAKRYEHDKCLCGFAHVDINGGWLRRNPTVHSYKDKMCPFVTTIKDSRFVGGGPRYYVINECSTGIDCDYAHSKEEVDYHHLQYKREVCYGVPLTASATPCSLSRGRGEGDGSAASGSSKTAQGICDLGDICPKLHTAESITYKSNVMSGAKDGHQSSPKLASNYNIGRRKPSLATLDDPQQQQHKYSSIGEGKTQHGAMPKGAPMLYIKPAPTSEFDKHFAMPGLQSLFRRHCAVLVAHLRGHNGDNFYYSYFGEEQEKKEKMNRRNKSIEDTSEGEGADVSVVQKRN
mmetsp:Transcript_681/g.976  ORF Transcript_681/g.976 Transcript_681/m.976 type:complete len:1208 (+) Transcript_681:145-3768(+)